MPKSPIFGHPVGMHATHPAFWRRLAGLVAPLWLVAGLMAAPAPAAPATLDQSILLGQVVPGVVDISTNLSYQGAVGAGAGNDSPEVSEELWQLVRSTCRRQARKHPERGIMDMINRRQLGASI